MSLVIRNLQIDAPAAVFDATVAFWAGTLDARPHQVDGTFVHLAGARSAVGVQLQRIDGGVAAYHLDLEADDVHAEVARLRAMGAEVVAHPPSGPVLVGPAGLRFCVVPDDAPPDDLADRRADRAYLDAIFIDVPPADAERATAFWSDALGARVEVPSEADHPYTYLTGLTGEGGEQSMAVQRVGDDPRFHVDVSVDDVDVEVARLQALGAQRVADVETWVTLADPAGNLLCVVPTDQEDDA